MKALRFAALFACFITFQLENHYCSSSEAFCPRFAFFSYVNQVCAIVEDSRDVGSGLIKSRDSTG